MSSSRKRKLKPWVSNVILALLFILGLGILLYPTISNLWNAYVNQKLINQYDALMQELNDEDYEAMWVAAKNYNDQHTKNKFTDAFDGEEYILKYPYDTLLNPMGNYIMGYIEIPKISQRLAIGHGTGIITLEQGVGHVEGTSLPIGGPGTHSVLAGHRGLPNAKLFTDLDRMVIGDKFFLSILNETLAYEVDQIEIVEPNDDSLLQLVDGEDYVTLLTCTPYGINTQRLLIRGHRIPFDAEDIASQAREYRLSDREKPALIMAGGVILLLLIVLLMRWHMKKKKNRENNEKKGG